MDDDWGEPASRANQKSSAASETQKKKEEEEKMRRELFFGGARGANDELEELPTIGEGSGGKVEDKFN